jgi:hypothetical protein
MRIGAVTVKTPQACEFELEGHRFLLQNFYVKDHAGNFMMSLMVEDADKWWDYIQSAGLAEKYNLHMATPPALAGGPPFEPPRLSFPTLFAVFEGWEPRTSTIQAATFSFPPPSR